MNNKNDIEIPLLDKSKPATTKDVSASQLLDHIVETFDTPDKYWGEYSKLRYLTFTDVNLYVARINNQQNRPLEVRDLPLPYNHYNIIKKTAILEKEWNQELRKSNPSLIWALYRTYKDEFYNSGVMMFLVFLGRIFSTMTLGKTISYISEGTLEDELDKSGLIRQAIAFAIIFLFTNWLNTHYWSYIFILGARIRMSIVGLLFKKIQSVSLSSLQEINIGKVINLLANDLNDIDTGYLFMWPLILSPLNFILTAWMMWEYFGLYTILSILALILAVFASQYISKKTQQPRVQKNSITDERIKLTNEIIECIRLIKMYAWEKPFRAIIEKLRDKEFAAIIRLYVIEVLGGAISEQAVYISAYIMFSIYTWLGGGLLTPEKVYASIMVLGFVRMWCIQFPHSGRMFIVNAKVIQKRVQDILYIPEVLDSDQSRPIDSPKSVSFYNYTAYWSKKAQKPCLENINLALNAGEVTAVIGKIGSGKTSFLLSFLKEIPETQGHLYCKGTIAYVEQEPIIFSGTVRSNILFGLEYDEELYNKVVKACSLTADFRQFADGDMTLIGERGINVSGGQKARISLARALYSRSDIYLLDDPLSAVDSKVARHLFENAIRSDLLKDKIVILVTHHISFAKESDRILVFDEGKIVADGKFEQLKSKNIDLLNLFTKEAGEEHERKMSRKKSSVAEESTQVEEEEQPKKFKEEQTVVTFQTYINYIKASGNMKSAILIFSLYVGQYAFFVGFNRFMGYWAHIQEEYYKTNGTLEGFNHAFYVGMGFLVTLGYFLTRYFKTLLSAKFFVGTHTALHAQMILKITRSVTSFFDITPVGSILNRFSNDLGQLDKATWQSLHDALSGLLSVVVLTLTVVAMNPLVILPCIIIGLGLARVRAVFAKPTQESKRLDLSSRSPLYSEISATINGLLIIRVFRQGGRIVKNFLELVYQNSRAMIFQQRTMRLFGLLLDIWLYVLTVAGIFLYIYISFSSVIDPGIFGMALSLLLEISNSSSYFIKQTLQMDINMQSTERVLKYCKLKEEAPDQVPEVDNEVLKEHGGMWPSKGEIVFKDVFMKYAPDLPYVLNGLNFTIPAGTKVGCVGRTGAGKSSIIQILFRMFEIENQPGSEIRIDGVNTKEVGLDLLRRNLSIIPQTAVIFTGTIRRNLDPFSQYSEQELWDVLEEVNLKNYVQSLEKKLDTDMTVSTTVFSAGQKQLVCLARAILRKSKIIVLDEATANVDIGTDNFIQEKINEKFKDCTVLTIAHRLTTIAHYDKILVLDKGRVVEYDAPYKLLVNEIGDNEITRTNGVFASMVKNTGRNTAKRIFEIAQMKYFNKKVSIIQAEEAQEEAEQDI